jgi:restriction system protein
MTHEKIAKAFFMTTSSFSEDAKSFAAVNRITLVDGPLFLMMIQRLPEVDRQKLLAFATEGDYRTPTCPSCGVKMVSRTGAPGKPDFWGCPRYPACRQRLGKRRE